METAAIAAIATAAGSIITALINRWRGRKKTPTIHPPPTPKNASEANVGVPISTNRKQ